MSKYQNTPSNKNKTQAEFNDSLYSNILSLISVILSVLSLVCYLDGKIQTNLLQKFTFKLSIICGESNSNRVKNQKLHVVEAQVNKERQILIII
ncbi:MAG: hypothetical protein ACLRPW_13410 [Intestinibacter sp.]